ncbi:hypothetical protein ACTFIR_011137 [Dictyostelium discoideum]
MFSEVKGNPINNNNNNNNNNKNKNNNNNSSKLEFVFQVLVSIILLYNTINRNNENSLIENFYKNSFLILSTTINICYQFFIKFNFTSKNLHSRSHKNNNDDNKLLVERQQSDWGLGLGISLIPNILLVILLTLNNNNNSSNNNNYFTIISLYQISLSIISPLFLFNHINTYRNSKIWKPSSSPSSSHQPSLTKKEYTNFIIIFLITLIISFTIFFDNGINFYNLQLTLFLFLLSFIFLVITKQLLYKLPNSFTLGEASIISQIITILLSESIRYFYNLFINNNNNNNDKFSRINILYCFYSLIVGSLFIVFLNSLFNVAKSLRKLMTDYNNNYNNNNNLIKNIIIKSSLFYFLVIFIIVGIIYPVLSYQLNGENPFIWVFEYIGSSDRIKYTIGLWMVLLVFTIFSYQPTIHSSIPMIISRKYFHILAIVMFTPPLLLEGDDDMYKFMVLSYSVSISALILLELLKYSLAPPLALPIRHYMDRFLDDRDSGLITTTHIYLLLGCSIPLFLTFFMDLIHLGSSGIQSNSYHFLSPFSGILTIGIGDTMASYFGVKYGRNKWFGSQKSIEGTVAGSVFTIIASLLLYWFCSASGSFLTISSILKIIVTSTSCSLMEASTTQIDNLILPLFYFTLINL